MGGCFICGAKVHGEKTRVCSSVTPHGNVPYPEKIAEIMGEEFVIIVTPADNMCKKCTSLLTHMDKIEYDLKLIKNTILTYIQKNNGLLPPEQPVRVLDIVNGNLKTDEFEFGQKKVPSGLNFKSNTVIPPLEKLKPATKNRNTASELKIYKCGFCSYQSKELGHVRFHMRSHVLKEDGEKANQTVAKTQESMPQQHQKQQQLQKKRLYRCQVCSASFNDKVTCLDHIQKNHNQQTSANEATNMKDNSLGSTVKVEKTEETLKSNTNQHAMSATDIGGQQDNKDAVNTAKLWKDNVMNEGPAAEKQDDLKIAKNDEVSTEEAMQVIQEITDSVVKSAEENMEVDGIENKAAVLDLELMLAAIHNDSPSNAYIKN